MWNDYLDFEGSILASGFSCFYFTVPESALGWDPWVFEFKWSYRSILLPKPKPFVCMIVWTLCIFEVLCSFYSVQSWHFPALTTFQPVSVQYAPTIFWAFHNQNCQRWLHAWLTLDMLAPQVFLSILLPLWVFAIMIDTLKPLLPISTWLLILSFWELC